MRLRSVWISEYKNLRNFSITFDGESFIDIFVGKNGSGKSNFLEAMIEIFDHLFDFERADSVPDFDYRIAYDLRGETTTIEWKDGTLWVNERERKGIGSTPRPDNVIVYYSGQNRNVARAVTLIKGLEAKVKSDAQKERFAKEVVPTLGQEYFEVFRPMFEHMKHIIAPPAAVPH